MYDKLTEAFFSTDMSRDDDVPAPLNSSSPYGTYNERRNAPTMSTIVRRAKTITTADRHDGTYNGKRNVPIRSTSVNQATTFTTVNRQFRTRTNDVRIYNVEQHFL